MKVFSQSACGLCLSCSDRDIFVDKSKRCDAVGELVSICARRLIGVPDGVLSRRNGTEVASNPLRKEHPCHRARLPIRLSMTSPPHLVMHFRRTKQRHHA